MFSAHCRATEEKDRIIVDGREEKRRFAVWKTQPEVTAIKGKGGGLRTARGGWITSKHDEIFLLTPQGLGVLTLYDAHGVVAKLNQLAQSLDVGAMREARWLLTKRTPDGPYPHPEPHFELLGVAGEANGPATESSRKRKSSAPWSLRFLIRPLAPR